jgi:hypothetical protein
MGSRRCVAGHHCHLAGAAGQPLTRSDLVGRLFGSVGL